VEEGAANGPYGARDHRAAMAELLVGQGR